MVKQFSKNFKSQPLPDGVWSAMPSRRHIIIGRFGRLGKLWCQVLFSVLAGLSLTSGAIAGVAEEYQVKAAFFYHFARFIEWPADKFSSKDDPFRVCIVGKNPFQGELENILSSKKVHNRSFSLMSEVSDSRLSQCHVVFVSNVAAERLKAVSHILKGKSVLTIGERSDFIQLGGMVRLFVENSKVRFGINPQATQQAHLEVSSKLLRLAKIEEP